MSTVKTEYVLVVPTSRFHQLGHFQGFSTDIDKYLNSLLDETHTSYRPRPEMEEDPSFKQLIPYVLFEYTDAEGVQHLFQYTRGKGQGEKRLHSKRSIGIGGHISSDDADSDNVYREGMWRELQEEVKIETAYEETCVGLINDDETEVGTVHLGVVHLFKVVEPEIYPNETEIAEAGFRPVTELLEELEQFETWSSITLKALYS